MLKRINKNYTQFVFLFSLFLGLQLFSQVAVQSTAAQETPATVVIRAIDNEEPETSDDPNPTNTPTPTPDSCQVNTGDSFEVAITSPGEIISLTLEQGLIINISATQAGRIAINKIYTNEETKQLAYKIISLDRDNLFNISTNSDPNSSHYSLLKGRLLSALGTTCSNDSCSLSEVSNTFQSRTYVNEIILPVNAEQPAILLAIAAEEAPRKLSSSNLEIQFCGPPYPPNCPTPNGGPRASRCNLSCQVSNLVITTPDKPLFVVALNKFQCGFQYTRKSDGYYGRKSEINQPNKPGCNPNCSFSGASDPMKAKCEALTESERTIAPEWGDPIDGKCSIAAAKAFADKFCKAKEESRPPDSMGKCGIFR